MARLFCQQHSAHLRDIGGSFGAIDREGGGTASTHQSRHFHNRPHSATCTRASDSAITKSLNEPSDVLAVETARRHHHDAAALPKVGHVEDAVVPEGVNRQTAVRLRFFEVLLPNNFKASS